MPTKEPAFGRLRGPLLKVCRWLLVALISVIINN